MIVYKDCEEFYLHGDYAALVVHQMIQDEGLPEEECAVGILYPPGSSRNQDIADRVTNWVLDAVKEWEAS